MAAEASQPVPRPYTLVAELTYRCPLQCLYCSNPIDYARLTDELDTQTWQRVFAEAAALGVVQVHLSGGEPASRRDLEPLVRSARAHDLYTNLITSGLYLDAVRLARLRDAGLDHVQVSVQDVDADGARRVAGVDAHAHKLAIARAVKQLGLALTINVVLSRFNVDRVAQLIELASELGADRLELASSQYYGWAFENRRLLMPSPAAYDRVAGEVERARRRLRGRMEIAYVKPDYFTGEPKACMSGWARQYMVVTPAGKVLPCHAAEAIAGLDFHSVRDRSLGQVWRSSPGLLAFRGDAWMQDPCRSCTRKGLDFGGCRCQSFLLTGDAASTDPACRLAPTHALVRRAVADARDDVAARFRNRHNSALIAAAAPARRAPAEARRAGSRPAP
jgi:pyrroloquinoline quinone biosynthesis protein E